MKPLWKPSEGNPGHQIFIALVPTAVTMLQTCCLLYSSSNFKTGISTQSLVAAAMCLLVPLLAVDPRGGYFDQCDLEYAMSLVAADPATQELTALNYTKSMCSTMEDFCSLAAFKIRVMLSHVRIKYREWLKKTPGQRDKCNVHADLATLYAMLADSGIKQPKASDKKKNLFVNFQ